MSTITAYEIYTPKAAKCANIFRGRGKVWELCVTTGASMIGAVLYGTYETKVAAKKAAAAAGLKPHNY